MSRVFQNRKSLQSNLLYLLSVAVITAVIYTATLFSAKTEPVIQRETILWAQTGIALAIMLLVGEKYALGIFLGAFLGGWSNHHNLLMATFMGIGSLLGALIGMLVLRSFQFQKSIDRAVDSYRLILFGSLASTAINALMHTIGIIVTTNSDWLYFNIIWFRDWQGHILGVLSLTPLLLIWATTPSFRFSFSQMGKAFVILASMVGMSILVVAAGTSQIAYLPFPFLIWATFWLGRRGSIAIAFLINLFALLLMVKGYGVNVNAPLDQFPDTVWLFMCAISATAVTIIAADSERQQTKHHLQTERDFAQQIMQYLGQGVTVTNIDSKFEFANDAFANMLGYEPSEIIGLQPHDFTIHSEHNKIADANKARRQSQSTSYELQMRHRDGHPIDTLITGVPRFANGRVVGAITVITNLTKFKEEEQRLRQSEQQYRQLFNAAQRHAQDLALLSQINAIIAQELDLEIIYTTVVTALSDTFGYDLVSLYHRDGDELHLQAQTGQLIVHLEMPITMGIIGRVVRTGTVALINDVTKDSDYIMPGGISHTQSQLCAPLFDETEVVGVINFEAVETDAFSDADVALITMLSKHVSIAITRTRLYNNVRHNEARFRALIKHNPASITLMDKNGNRIATGASSTQIWGYDSETFLHENAFEMIHPDDLEKANKIFNNIVNKPDASASFIHRVRHADGSWRWVETTLTNLFDEPAVHAIVVNAHDITDRKKAEDVLQHTQKLESLGVLAGGIAHDFNNLLVAIMGQISIAQVKSSEDGRHFSHLNKALQAAERAQSLTQQLLAYTGRGHFQVVPLNLNQLIEENLHLFKMALSQTVTLETDLSPSLPMIEADASQMQQIIMNLIINAVEAIGEQPGNVRIVTKTAVVDSSMKELWLHASLEPAPGQHILFSVEDDGAGMNETTVKKIFDPFFTTKFTGRGLGLAAVQGIIRGHNGGLQVISSVGKGSLFKIYFPIKS